MGDSSYSKQLKVHLDGKPHAVLNLDDECGEQIFTVSTIASPGSQPWTLRFKILALYPGSKWDDTIISEIYFEKPKDDAK